MKITIISVGKIKEKFYKDAIKEYEKRLNSYTKLNMIELSDEKTKSEQDSEILIAMNKEGQNILSKIKDGQFVITLEILGENISSESFASKLNSLMISGNSDVVFVIGGSYGLSDEVKKRSNYALSFSKMTFPHQMMKVILTEQIYRAYRIINNHSYHK